MHVHPLTGFWLFRIEKPFGFSTTFSCKAPPNWFLTNSQWEAFWVFDIVLLRVRRFGFLTSFHQMRAFYVFEVFSGGPEMLCRHLNFHQISHRFTLSFTNPSFQDLSGSHIMYWNMIILNPSRFKVEPHSKYWYFCIECVDLLSLRFSENAVLFHI